MTAIQCTELPALDLGGTSDPYVKVNMKEGKMYGSIRGAETLEGKDGAGVLRVLGLWGDGGVLKGNLSINKLFSGLSDARQKTQI